MDPAITRVNPAPFVRLGPMQARQRRRRSASDRSDAHALSRLIAAVSEGPFANGDATELAGPAGHRRSSALKGHNAGLTDYCDRLRPSTATPGCLANKEEIIVDVAQQNRRKVDPLEQETIKKVAWRLIPVLVFGYFAAYLDRVNVGMAAPTMMPDLVFTSSIFGFGAGLGSSLKGVGKAVFWVGMGSDRSGSSLL
jgi:hypothetical protein